MQSTNICRSTSRYKQCLDGAVVTGSREICGQLYSGIAELPVMSSRPEELTRNALGSLFLEGAQLIKQIGPRNSCAGTFLQASTGKNPGEKAEEHDRKNLHEITSRRILRIT